MGVGSNVWVRGPWVNDVVVEVADLVAVAQHPADALDVGIPKRLNGLGDFSRRAPSNRSGVERKEVSVRRGHGHLAGVQGLVDSP